MPVLPPSPPPSARRAALAVLALGAAVRLALAATLPPTPDELATWRGAGSPIAHVASVALATLAGHHPLALRGLGVLAAALAPAALVPNATDSVRFALGVLALPALVWSGLLAGPGPWVYAGSCLVLAGVLRGFGVAGLALGALGLGLVGAGAAGTPLALGSWVWAVAAGGVLVLPAAPWALAALRAGDRVDRACLAGGVLGVVAGVAVPGLAAAGWTAFGLGLARAGGGFARGTWVAAGLGLLGSGVLAAHSARPMVVVDGDPTARLGVGADLGRSVEAWALSPVYTDGPEEAALIAWYGKVDTWSLDGAARPPAAAHALYVRAWRGGPGAAIDDACARRGGANVVSEYNPDGSPLDRWQVYEVWDCDFARTAP